MTRKVQGLGVLMGHACQVDILLNVQFAMKSKHSAYMFLFIVLGIFLLFFHETCLLHQSTVGVFADLRGGDMLQ